jgi:hypothetical protein
MSWLVGDRWLYYGPPKASSSYSYYSYPGGDDDATAELLDNNTTITAACDASPSEFNRPTAIFMGANTGSNNNNDAVVAMMMNSNRNAPNKDNSGGAEEDEEGLSFSPAHYASVFLLLHSVATVACIALVAELFGRASPTAALTVSTYMLAPADAACQAWTDGECVVTMEELRWPALRGVAQLVEHKTRGLLAEVNPAVLCLVVQTALAACFTPMFRRVRAAVLLGMAVLLLFQQTRWRLSFGGLLWCELMLMVTFFLTGTRHGYGAVEGHRLLGMPMLMVATLAVAGENDASALVVVYLSLSAMMLAWTAYARVETEAERGAVALNACLAFVPFVLRVGLRLDAIAHLPVAVPGWTLAALLFALVWLVLFVATHSLMPYLPHSALVGLFFLDQMAHTTLVLLVIIGLMSVA